MAITTIDDPNDRRHRLEQKPVDGPRNTATPVTTANSCGWAIVVGLKNLTDPLIPWDRFRRFRHARLVLAAVIVMAAGIDANLLPAFNGWRHLDRAPSISGVEERDRLYRELAAWLPPTGSIGYIPPPDWPSAGAVRDFFLASYALAPRHVIVGTAPEFVIVTAAASVDADTDPSARTSNDPRLAGFVLVRTGAQGARLFRRLP
jgi:hypothetical protein